MKDRIVGTSSYFSESQRAEVSDRGAGFGDISLFTIDEVYEGGFCWDMTGRVSGREDVIFTRAQKDRAVRALAETPQGKICLKLPDSYDPTTVPSADQAEKLDILRSAIAAGLLDPETLQAAFAAPVVETDTTEDVAAEATDTGVDNTLEKDEIIHVSVPRGSTVRIEVS